MFDVSHSIKTFTKTIQAKYDTRKEELCKTPHAQTAYDLKHTKNIGKYDNFMDFYKEVAVELKAEFTKCN
ncbi:MAG: hypothetical protein SOW25_01215 [Helicobacter sp.]|nr:hypothetical protein [Helicobacteraceae bacterium]MDY3112932.1 hypothetical protein [Helicobacter sp.]